MEKRETIRLRVPPWFKNQFQARCDERGMTMSEAVRSTIEKTWGLREPPQAGTAQHDRSGEG
jgi:antitoxin component of RelBE/YafQ-DinJ toxin-antitoxin module